MTIRPSRRKLRLGMQLVRSNPWFAGRVTCRWLNRLYHRRGYLSDFNERGIDVFEQDWDNLLLLDACRWEMLEDHPFDGEFRTVQSKGSDTFEFLSANCEGTDLSDTVYVSASPLLDWHRDTIDHNFHDVVFVWNERGWDEDEKTVLPEDVYDLTLEAAERYPRKRLLVHFLQPHYPFIDAGTDWDKRQLHDPDDTHPSFWRMIETGLLDVTPERIWELYEHNLERTLPYVEGLVEELGGTSVVTSDHANMFGEPSYPIPIREWGHPAGTYTSQLVTVPWIECASGSRREIVAEDPTSESTSTDRPRESVRNRLEDLGYVK